MKLITSDTIHAKNCKDIILESGVNYILPIDTKANESFGWYIVK